MLAVLVNFKHLFNTFNVFTWQFLLPAFNQTWLNTSPWHPLVLSLSYFKAKESHLRATVQRRMPAPTQWHEERDRFTLWAPHLRPQSGPASLQASSTGKGKSSPLDILDWLL